MNRIIRIVLAAAVSLSLAGCRAADTAATASASASASGQPVYTTLRVGMECAYAPNNWEEDKASDTNLPISNNSGFYAEGYDVQMAKRIGKAVGADIQIVKLSWDGLIEALNNGQIDMIIAGMADTEERKQSVAFSNTYAIRQTVYTIMVQKDSKYASATSLADFTGASILGQKDTFLDTVIDQIPNVNHVSPVATIPNMVDRLNAGTVDGIVINQDTAAAYEKTYPNLVAVEFPEGKGFVLGFTGSCVGLRKSDTDLLAKVNDALAAISTQDRQAMMDTATANMPQ